MLKVDNNNNNNNNNNNDAADGQWTTDKMNLKTVHKITGMKYEQCQSGDLNMLKRVQNN